MSNITINNFSSMSLKVSKSDYWDFKLSKDNDTHLTNLYNGKTPYTDSLITYIDFNDSRCIGENGVIYSVDNYKWDKAVNKGLSLKNIGLTGVDNGKIIVNEDNYDDIIKNSVLTIESDDLRLQLTKVGSNTGLYEYPVEIVGESENNIGRTAELKGGFYQGFFKSGKNYHILPSHPETEIAYEFLLKPEYDTSTNDKTLNKIEGYDNDGIFFYLGLRAENKFLYEYANFGDRFNEKSEDGVIYPIENLKTSSGIEPSNKDYSEIDTDNKYLLFNRTKTGLRVDNFDSDTKYIVQNNTPIDKTNKYVTYNRTADGLRASNSDKATDDTDNNFINDTYLNQIAFRIKSNGTIGYRTIIHDCDNPKKYSISEEYSKKMVINVNWCLVTVRMITSSTNRNFKLLFYVNGELVLTSKELPELKLRKLSIHDELQEGVPYNISLGGGTQGLVDMVGFNDNYNPQYVLPIERYFAGSFIGKISQFKIYNNKLTYEKILNNVMHIKNKLSSEVVDLRYYTIYYGTSNIKFTEFSQIETLQNKIGDYNRVLDRIELETGNVDNIFMFAVPMFKVVDNIEDMGLFIKDDNFKNLYVESIITITESISYKLYTMENALPYSSNHKHIITFKV